MTRILFVDDEPNIREGMRRMLRSMRNEWEMEFAESGEAALGLIDEWRSADKPFDVVVSDMRMPGMDGADLLARVKEVSPDSVRLILSGHSDTASIMKTVGNAHQYLNKPCDPELLKRTIKRAFALRMLLRDEHLQKIVGQIGSLPSLPVVYQEVMACLQKPNASLGDVGKVIGKDVGMTATLLKLVSSAFFGLSKPVSTVERAVSFLGLDTLIALVLAQGIFKEAPPINVAGFSIEGLWQHSLETASAARMIAGQQGLDKATLDDAFLAGMLHDIGKLVLAQVHARAVRRGADRRQAPALQRMPNRKSCRPRTPMSAPICSACGGLAMRWSNQSRSMNILARHRPRHWACQPSCMPQTVWYGFLIRPTPITNSCSWTPAASTSGACGSAGRYGKPRGQHVSQEIRSDEQGSVRRRRAEYPGGHPAPVAQAHTDRHGEQWRGRPEDAGRATAPMRWSFPTCACRR